LLNALVKLAGGAKKGTTFATHMSLAELKASLKERMTAFHRVEVQGEAPSIRKGALKPISIEMKRAAGHNKTHVSGLESFCISPQAVSDALKVKLGCTTAVLKLPGNNTKDVEVLLQGHCVNEVCDYLRDVYCIEKQWIELKLKESKRSNT
jgi:translation initiation factor 2D